MDTKTRTVAKALTWQAMGLAVMTLITFLVTGSVAEGGIVALAGALVGSITYILHERAWDRITWGRT